MPLIKEGIVTLSNKELQAIFGLDVFQNQKHLLLEELRSRCNLEPLLFRQVHQAPECQLGFRVLGSRPSGFISADMDSQAALFKIQIECSGHKIASEPYEELGFPKDLQEIK